MKKIILIATIAIITLASCFKSNNPKRTFRYVGHIYNIEDSLPFRNTQFKVHDKGIVGQMGTEKNLLFTTDSNGYFDVTSEFMGSVYWPSYYWGSGYLGPDVIYSVDDSLDVTNNQLFAIYNSYTKPYF